MVDVQVCICASDGCNLDYSTSRATTGKYYPRARTNVTLGATNTTYNTDTNTNFTNVTNNPVESNTSNSTADTNKRVGTR